MNDVLMYWYVMCVYMGEVRACVCVRTCVPAHPAVSASMRACVHVCVCVCVCVRACDRACVCVSRQVGRQSALAVGAVMMC